MKVGKIVKVEFMDDDGTMGFFIESEYEGTIFEAKTKKDTEGDLK